MADIKKFKAGQRWENTSAKNWNKIVARANRQIIGKPPIKTTETPVGTHITTTGGDGWWLGEIDASGQALDYSDARYYVKKQVVLSTDYIGPRESDKGDVVFPSDFVFVATNLPEINSDTHFLREGQEVIVFETEDGSDPPKTIYYMSEPAWRNGITASDFYVISDIRTSDATRQYRVRKDSYEIGLLVARSDGGWHPWRSDAGLEADLYVISDIRTSDANRQYRLRKDSYKSGLLIAKSDAGWSAWNSDAGISVTEVLVSDIRVSDVKIQYMLVSDVYVNGTLTAHSNQGWSTWHTGSDCA